jgi:Sulfatase
MRSARTSRTLYPIIGGAHAPDRASSGDVPRMRPLPLPAAKVRAIHLFALCAFGIAQPSYNLLAKNPDYFVSAGFHPIDVVLYAFLVLIVPPAVLMAAELLAGLAHRGAAVFLHKLFVGMLVFLVFARGIPTASVLGKLGAALVIGVVFVRAYNTWRPVRSLVSVCALGSVLFLAVFLVKAPLGKLAVEDVQAAPLAHSGLRTPVVLIIFDEFAESSLMTEKGRIDAARYPNFAALARTATWYRNATTVHDYTEWAVPSILTGQLPRQSQLPLLADHPHNIFTLLGGTYRIHAVEPVTRLCPTDLCSRGGQQLGTRVRRLASSIGSTAVYGHPGTDNPQWRDPPRALSGFLAGVHPSSEPQLYVLHLLLPHGPWRYLPSGRAYQPFQTPQGLSGKFLWADDVPLVDRSYREHLLQVGYVDRILGEIVGRLRANGLWNRSLVVVTADHGVSFVAGQNERTVSRTNIGNIAPVPLFVKTPGERTGHVDVRRAQTIDIVPTIADELGIAMPWKVDGASLLRPDRPYPSTVVVRSHTGRVVGAPWRVVAAQRAKTIERRARIVAGLARLQASLSRAAPR